jgi:transposase-like protein
VSGGDKVIRWSTAAAVVGVAVVAAVVSYEHACALVRAAQARPLDEVYAAIFIDAIMVKVRDGQVANRSVYAAIGVTLAGEKDILGLWAGTGGEGAKFWMSVLTRPHPARSVSRTPTTPARTQPPPL